jgi:hypothetical protein
MEFLNKAALKDMLGELPLAAELYWQLRQPGRPLNESFQPGGDGKAHPGMAAGFGSFLEIHSSLSWKTGIALCYLTLLDCPCGFDGHGIKRPGTRGQPGLPALF